ncbi:MAG: glycosyl transferase family 2 [Cyanobacteria bacterium QH_8_48_120]|jgi:glycosyltransferase involved in cell wall biosynthesis|nr:MAG: glycosyl transferase family 2 [Cyanobacteria bacterium QH_1_48_107]PSO65565.1 MAG: glycosyl transferase family 2 [Cyanobacteria bacterium QH_6_48_35]PSO69457.1 MAG: glycosyl transferase family 2 [Cyanobacteria bacterium QH_8_48_120]
MSQKTTVSVAMSVYNSERYVAQAIESVLAQTFRDFEFLIIDDGSTDASLKILEVYAAQDKRIRLTSRKNRGISQTRNEMLNQAQGEYVAVMDADDVALPERFALQVEFLERNPDVVCVGGAHELIDEKGRLLTCLKLPESDAEIQQKALAGHCSISHPCAMIRRASLSKVGGYDETMPMAIDLDLWLRLGEVGKLANLKDAVLKYRLHTNSISEQNRVQQRSVSQNACERALRRRGMEGHFEATAPWRPGTDSSSQHQFMLKYGWWAFNSSQRQTALIYGTKAIAALPFAVNGWKLLACAAFKPLPKSNSKKS